MRRLLRAILGLGGAQIAGLMLGMVATKIMAVVLGPSGIGFYSLVRQVNDAIVGFSALGGGHGLIQGLATRSGAERVRLLATGLWLTLGGVTVAVALVLTVSGDLAKLIFNEAGAATTMKFVALGVAINAASSFLITLVQANGRFGSFSIGQIAASIILAAIAYPVARAALDERAAFVAMIVLPCLVQIAWAVRPLRQAGEIANLAQAAQMAPSREGLRHFSRFLLFGLSMMAVVTLSGTVVRALIVRHYGLEAAGHFQAAWTLGMQNLTLLLTPFMTYVYPVLAGARDQAAHRAAWIDISTVIVGGALPLVVGAIVFKPLFIKIFYTGEFLSAVPVLQWMLLANYIKAIGWLFAVAIYSAGHLRLYFLGEAVWNLSFAGMVLACTMLNLPPFYIGVAFLAAYAVFLPLVAVLAYRRYRLLFTPRLLAVSIIGTSLIVACALATWNETTVNWPLAVVASLVAFVIGFAVLPASRRNAVWRSIRLTRGAS